MTTGIQEYWLVNTKAREIYIYVFEDKEFSRMLSFGEGKRAESQYFKGLGVDLKRVFEIEK